MFEFVNKPGWPLAWIRMTRIRAPTKVDDIPIFQYLLFSGFEVDCDAYICAWLVAVAVVSCTRKGTMFVFGRRGQCQGRRKSKQF